MNDEPFRMPRHAERSASRQAPTPTPPPRQPEVPVEIVEEPKPQPVEERPKPVRRATASEHRPRLFKEKRSLKRLVVPTTIVAVIILGLIGWSALSRANGNEETTISSNKYQAVSFTDGQLYFGKLTVLNDKYLKLTDVYYLQPQADDSGKTSSDSVQKATTNQNFKLVKFTDVLYGPEDEMTIPKSQVLFYENINPTGKVAQLIQQYKKSH